jgi:DNA mismatch repair protein MutL
MPKVIVLPDHIASQIAAGEVIERPASVVKELVENSVDAGASQIEIAVAADCRDIRVADDGCGMEADDAALAFQRHATSKLTSADDLFKLRSLGFRGEALPSIASISKLVCYTRTADKDAGVKVEVTEGKVTVRETGCAQGTAIEVSDLFYNVPARLSFLKKPQTEFAHIHEIVQSLAVAYPKITFQLLNNGEVILRTSGSGKLAQVMQEVGILPHQTELLPVTHADLRYGMAIYGYVARPPLSRGDRKGLLAIVNNRPVRCPLTFKALDQAYQDLIPKGKYPIGVLSVTIDPGQIDVNIHPTKKEIKYSNSSDVYSAIYHALGTALRARHNGADADSHTANGEQTATTYTTRAAAPVVSETTISAPAFNPRATFQRIQQLSLRPEITQTAQAQAQAQATTPMPSSAVSDPDPVKPKVAVGIPAGWRIVGYLHNTYILLETPEGLEIVEQHIAHERLIYERVLARQNNPGRITENSQRLVISAPLELTPTQRACLLENIESLRAVGYDFDVKGDAVACTQVPLEMATKSYASSVQQTLEHILTAGKADFQLEATKSLACQAAIKNGMPLSEAEIIELLGLWSQAPRNDTCPHGRPVSLKFSRDKLFQLFHPK